MPATSEQFIRAFTGYLQFQKRYSRHTILAYENDLNQYADFLTTNYADTNITAVTAFMVRSWLASLKEQSIASRTINRKISALKSFYKYLLKQGEIKSHPMTQVISPKTPKRLPQYVEEQDLETLLRHVEYDEGFEGLTQQLILQLLYFTGMRRSELIGLKNSNVDVSNRTIRVLGKGNKERIIPVGENLLERIKEYREAKANLGVEADQEVLLITAKGKKLHDKYVYLIVKKYLALVTTLEKKSPHILRHSFATHLSANGADINAIKELLGHSSLAATQVYTHNNIQKLKDIHEKAHPRA
jgi:integrase/recombinase XerC